jgi:ubiquinone/menaquinone biosynthesis C-methylase UbiE
MDDDGVEMGLGARLLEFGGNPTGPFGRVLGRLMNAGHGDSYRWGLDHVTIAPDAEALDVGCGGGRAVSLLAARVTLGKVCGIDHSLDMVKLSRRVNRTLIKGGRVEIDHGSVSSLPYSDNTFDLVTAFETIEFWPSLAEDMQEVKRVLKPSGVLLVVNRCPGAKERDKWAERLQLCTPGEFRDCLRGAGFRAVSVDEDSRPGWIAASAVKQ